ncbi:hypothetical protein D3C87_1682000 [compost metagenome]
MVGAIEVARMGWPGPVAFLQPCPGDILERRKETPIPFEPFGQGQAIEHVAAGALGVLIAFAASGFPKLMVERGRQFRNWSIHIPEGGVHQLAQHRFSEAAPERSPIGGAGLGKGREFGRCGQHHADMPDVPAP